MSLVLADSFNFFNMLWKSKNKKGIAVAGNGRAFPFHLKDLKVDDENTPTKGFATITTAPTVELAYRTEEFIDLSKVEAPDFLYDELYYTVEHMVDGAPLVEVDPKQGGTFAKGTSASLTIKGSYLVEGITFDAPAEITIDNITYVNLETVTIDFTNTYSSLKEVVTLKVFNANGIPAENSIVLEFK